MCVELITVRQLYVVSAHVNRYHSNTSRGCKVLSKKPWVPWIWQLMLSVVHGEVGGGGNWGEG